jgi:hypothetical protein
MASLGTSMEDTYHLLHYTGTGGRKDLGLALLTTSGQFVVANVERSRTGHWLVRTIVTSGTTFVAALADYSMLTGFAPDKF